MEAGSAAPQPSPLPAVDSVRPSPAANEPTSPGQPEPVHMMQSNGQLWPVPDMGTFHRWILEHRVTRNDMVSHQGVRWQRAGERADLEIFFQAADRMTQEMSNQAALAVTATNGTAPGQGIKVGRRAVPAPLNVRREIYPAAEEEPASVIDEPIPAEDEAMPLRVGPAGGDYEGLSEPENMVMDFTDVTSTIGVSPFSRDDTQEATIRSGSPMSMPDPEATEFIRSPIPKVPQPVLPSQLSQTQIQHPQVALQMAGAQYGGQQVGLASMGPTSMVSHHTPMTAVPLIDERTDSPAITRDPTPAPRRTNEVYADSRPPPGQAARMLAVLAALFVICVLLVVVIVQVVETRGRRSRQPVAVQTTHVDPNALTSTAGAGSVPAVTAPVATEPVATQPVATEPVATQPVATQPVATEPVATQPVATQPVATQPVATQPVATQPVAAKPPSAKKLVDMGWDEINKHDYQAARDYFARALQSKPGMSGALYGRGYTSEKLGDKGAAAADYCRAIAAGPDTDTQRELQGALRRIEKSCE